SAVTLTLSRQLQPRPALVFPCLTATPTTYSSTRSLPDALPIYSEGILARLSRLQPTAAPRCREATTKPSSYGTFRAGTKSAHSRAVEQPSQLQQPSKAACCRLASTKTSSHETFRAGTESTHHER